VSNPPAATFPGVSVAAAGGELLAVIAFEGFKTRINELLIKVKLK